MVSAGRPDVIATFGGVVFHEDEVDGRVVIVVDIVDAAWFTLPEARLLAARLMNFAGEPVAGGVGSDG